MKPVELLAAREVVKMYEEADAELAALRGVSLGIARGDVVAIIGPSGSGKTTLLNVLGALDQPTSGEVLFDGVPLDDLDATLAEWRNGHVGFVFQDHLLLPEFSALRNVMLPMRIGRRVSRGEAAERAAQLLDDVGLAHRARHRPGELSGGQRQRVAIARALANEPDVILADEPTGNLDRTTAREIYALFERLNTERGVTFVIVTHDQEAAAAAHRTVTLVDGRVVSDERHR